MADENSMVVVVRYEPSDDDRVRGPSEDNEDDRGIGSSQTEQ